MLATTSTQSGDEDRIKQLHSRLLYYTIAIEYLDPTIENGIPARQFKANCRAFLTDPFSYDATDQPVDKLISSLEKQGYIAIGDYGTLKQILAFDKRILELINKTEREIQNHGGTIKRRNSKRKCVEINESQRGVCSVLPLYM